MPQEKGRQNGIRAFFATTLWEMNPDDYRGAKRLAINCLQMTALVIRAFRSDQCALRAAALSFTTMLSIVPFLALAFAVLKGLGVQNRVEPFLLSQVAAGSAEVIDRIVTYINNTRMASLGTVGLLSLVVTVISLLGHVEDAFNIVWGVKETRPLSRKFSDYLSVLVSAPLLMLAAMSVATSLQSKTLVQWVRTNTYLGDVFLYGIRLVQHVSVWAALIFLYVFIPNTKVRLKSALVGGILAGTLWQATQWGYIHFQVGVARYNAIYGTMAVLPIFMVWIYTSWLIVLLGVELVCAHQNIRTFRRELRVPASHGMKELFALAALQSITERFHGGLPPVTVETLAEELDIPARITREIIEILEEEGYVAEIAGDPPACQPARDIDDITVKEVLDALRNAGGAYEISSTTRGEELISAILAKADAGVAAALSGMTLKDLIGRRRDD